MFVLRGCSVRILTYSQSRSFLICFGRCVSKWESAHINTKLIATLSLLASVEFSSFSLNRRECRYLRMLSPNVCFRSTHSYDVVALQSTRIHVASAIYISSNSIYFLPCRLCTRDVKCEKCWRNQWEKNKIQKLKNKGICGESNEEHFQHSHCANVKFVDRKNSSGVQ